MPHTARPPRLRHPWVNLPPGVSQSLKFISIALVVAGLYFGRDILVPLALAALLGFVLDPLVTRLCGLGLRRGAAVAVVSLGTLAAVVGITLVIGMQLVQIGSDLPQYQQTIERKLAGLRQQLMTAGSLDSASQLLLSVERQLEATRRALEHEGAVGRVVSTVRVVDSASPLAALAQWASPILDRLLTGGIATVLLLVILMERHELCDRVLTLAGPNLRPMTEALNEAARRVSAYLSMQVLVNAGFGVTLGAGLWLLGIPGSFLWGALAALLRFVPYLGPVLAAAFPLALAFAIDPGWSLLLWTGLLIISLELVLNNLVEPWLYGSSAGLATVAILLSAAFWTALWGPVGLILSTPISVCLVVLGRHLPPFRFLDVLFGSDPVFDARTRLYRRLSGGHVGEATALANKLTQADGLPQFYSRSAIPALAEVSGDRATLWGDAHRQRVTQGMQAVVSALQGRVPAPGPAAAEGADAVWCVGLNGPSDALSAGMLAHALQVAGLRARAVSADAWGDGPDGVMADRDAERPACVVLVSYHPAPQRACRLMARRLRKWAPAVQVLAGFWRDEQDPLPELKGLQADVQGVFHTLEDGVRQLVAVHAPHAPQAPLAAATPAAAARQELVLPGLPAQWALP